MNSTYVSIFNSETSGFNGPRFVAVDMGPFEVTVAIANDGKFLGVYQIAEKTDFRSLRQRVESSSYADVSDLYADDSSE